MEKVLLGLMLLVMVMWGGWPLLTRDTASNAFDTLTMGVVAILPVLFFAAIQGELAFTGRHVRFSGAGIMMGVGLVAYIMVMSNPHTKLSFAVPTINVGMLIVTLVGANWFLGEKLTLREYVGIATMLTGICIASPR